MTEAELDRAVRQMVREHWLYGFRPDDSRRSTGRGWPDWTIVGRRLLFRELKTDGGELRPEQSRVRNLLLAAGQDWAVWRPADLASGRIARELAAVA